MKVRRRMTWPLLAVLASLSSAVSAEEAWTTRQVTLDIQPQPLGQALNAFAAQTGLQIAGLSESWAGLSAPRLVGTFSVQSALQQLLANTSLDYQVIDAEGMVAIRPQHARNKTTSLRQPPLRIADASASVTASSTTTVDTSVEDGNETEVVVTGSHIRGSVSAGSHVMSIDREEIEHSGRSRLQDLFETLPQNFSGSGSVDSTKGIGYNVNRGTGIDLRGLGTGTTLVLVNGHRQPAGDLYGSMVDISTVPAAAVERVEILTDGASAVYGSDAIGGVVNFILRKDYEGAETGLRYGSLDGNADELQFSQLFGTSWSSGNAMIGYQYQKRDPLQAADVPYRATMGDQRKFGGTDQRQNWSNPGVILDSRSRPAYAIPTGQDGSDLDVADLIALNGVLPDGYPRQFLEDKWVTPEETVHTVFVSATQRLTDRLELFAEGRYGKRDMKALGGGRIATFSVPSSNPFYVNPFGGTAPVRVAYNFHDDGLIFTEQGETEVHSETAGIVASLNDWQVTLSGFYGEEKNRYQTFNDYNTAAATAALNSTNPNTALNVFGDGANNRAVIDAIRASDINIDTMQLWGGGVIADGPLLTVFDRDLRLAVGADYRSEGLDFVRDLQREFPLETRNDRAASEDRHISAAFAELAVPLVARDDDRVGLKQLEMSLAGRYEDYSDFGSTFNPKVGLRWQPLDALQLRGTWGTSFRAPKLIEIAPGYTNNLRTLRETTVNNPTVPGTTYRILLNQQQNSDLHEETADVWTAGFDFAPPSLPGLRVSMSYFDISYSDKIEVVTSTAFQDAQAFAAYAKYIVASPTQQQVDALCNQFPGVCTGAPIGAILNNGLNNLSKVFVAGMDLDVSQSLDTAIGTFDFSLGGTRLSRYDRVVVAGTPTLDVLNTTGNPLELRLRGKASWGFKDWTTGVYVNYTNDYDNPTGLPAKVDSWTTFDVNVSYRVTSGSRWLQGSRLSLSVLNVGDELPPFINTDAGYDPANADITGRSMSLQFVKEW